MENNKKVTETDNRLQKDNPTLDTHNIEQGKPADLSKDVKQTPPEKPDFMPGNESKTPAAAQQTDVVPQKNDSGNDEKTAVKQTPPEDGERPKANAENSANPGEDQHHTAGSTPRDGDNEKSEMQKNLDAARNEPEG